MGYKARYYDPKEEFFSSYVYCGNNPLVFVDPTGMAMEVSADGNITSIDDTFNDGKLDKNIYMKIDGIQKQIGILNDYEEVQEKYNFGGVKDVTMRVPQYAWDVYGENLSNRVGYIDGVKYLLVGIESLGSGALDYKGCFSSSTIYIFQGIGYTDVGIGNYFWASTLKEYGIPKGIALFGAWANNLVNGRRDNENLTLSEFMKFKWLFDDEADKAAHERAYK